MKHGEKRGEIVTRTTSDLPPSYYTIDNLDGNEEIVKVVKVRPGTLTETGRERWCETCNDWVLSLGVIANLMCHQCHTPW